MKYQLRIHTGIVVATKVPELQHDTKLQHIKSFHLMDNVPQENLIANLMSCNILVASTGQEWSAFWQVDLFVLLRPTCSTYKKHSIDSVEDVTA